MTQSSYSWGHVQNVSEQDLQETLYASVYHNSHSSEEVEVTQCPSREEHYNALKKPNMVKRNGRLAYAHGLEEQIWLKMYTLFNVI